MTVRVRGLPQTSCGVGRMPLGRRAGLSVSNATVIHQCHRRRQRLQPSGAVVAAIATGSNKAGHAGSERARRRPSPARSGPATDRASSTGTGRVIPQARAPSACRCSVCANRVDRGTRELEFIRFRSDDGARIRVLRERADYVAKSMKLESFLRVYRIVYPQALLSF